MRMRTSASVARPTRRPSPATLFLLTLAVLVVHVVVALLLAIEEAHRCGRGRGRRDQ